MLHTLLSRISTARASGTPLTRIDLTPAELRELEFDIITHGIALDAGTTPTTSLPPGARLVLLGVPVYCEAP